MVVNFVLLINAYDMLDKPCIQVVLWFLQFLKLKKNVATFMTTAQLVSKLNGKIQIYQLPWEEYLGFSIAEKEIPYFLP